MWGGQKGPSGEARRGLNLDIMARPIKETPILTGQDADRFAAAMNTVGKASEKEIEEAQRAYEAIKAISNFPM